MAQERLRQKRLQRRIAPEEKDLASQSTKNAASRSEARFLQQQVGNRAAQDLLRQRGSFAKSKHKTIGRYTLMQANHRSLPTVQLQPEQEGPQSFAGGTPGTEALDPALVAQNNAIEQGLFGIAEDYYRQGDLRWFFAYAHAQITRQINENLSSFQRPNALLRLNMHFAEEFARAVQQQSHSVWRRAFRVCQALQHASSETPALVGEAESCGALMASVHIGVDLVAALNEVGCIPPADYGNMLAFVDLGMLAAIVRLRGRAVASMEVMVQALVAPMLDLEVKSWRNAAYMSICNTPVPEVEPGFVK